MAIAAALAEEEDRLLACVHCGFCLQACPTYTRLGDEADSPRGRLYLMRAVAEGRLDARSEAFTTHIDRCLGCRACETVCPSGVEYGHLLERARETVATTAGTGPETRLLLGVFGSRLGSRLAMAGARLFRATGLATLLARLLPRPLARIRFGLAMLGATRPWPALRRIAGAEKTVPSEFRGPGSPRPEVAAAAPAGSPTARAPRLRVAMLTGCVQDGLFGRVNAATTRVLEANDCEVMAVPEQVCCGALHAHAGARDRARELARSNIEAFEAAGVDHVVVNAAGCGAAMKEYGMLLADDPAWAERARAFSARVRDVSEFLAELGPRPGAPLRVRVTYDAPCHLHHAQRITHTPLAVLSAAVPGIEIAPLRNADECCGGAGIYGLLHPELGGKILDDKVDAVLETGADVVVTPNPGCMMQIGAGLVLAGSEVPVLHPIELLDESYRRAAEEPDEP